MHWFPLLYQFWLSSCNRFPQASFQSNFLSAKSFTTDSNRSGLQDGTSQPSSRRFFRATIDVCGLVMKIISLLLTQAGRFCTIESFRRSNCWYNRSQVWSFSPIYLPHRQTPFKWLKKLTKQLISDFDSILNSLYVYFFKVVKKKFTLIRIFSVLQADVAP